MNDFYESRDASELAEEHYTAYGIYVNQKRALASIYDGLKTVQRRIIYEANKLPDKLTKSTNLVGNAIKLHPHGSSSIYGAIIGMANPTCNLKLFDTKGNWGGYGFGAAADRYTECKLSKLAKFIYCQFVDYAPMEIGEIGIPEPVYLPCLLPYGLVEGNSGIGIGLSADIVPLNILDLIDYYLYYIENNEFSNDMIVRPDFGSSILWMSDDDCKNNVQKYSGTFYSGSTIKQESETIFVVESLYGKSIEKVLSRLRKYIDSDKVDFRNETKTAQRFVFEIMDYTVDSVKFKKDLQDATYKKSSFNRVFDVSGKSIYSTLNYTISNQMRVLNEAIDKKVSSEIAGFEKRKIILEGLKFFKSKGVFNNIGLKTTDELINDMKSYKWKDNVDNEIYKEIISKPISYLTKSHDEELNNIYSSISDLKNHNRKEYLIGLYNELKSMISETFNLKKHSILESQMLNNPKAKLINDNNIQKIQVTDKGRGIKFNNFIYLIGENGSVYRRSISVMSRELINIDTEEKIVGIVSDMDNYIVLRVSKDSGVVFHSDNYKYDKRWVNLSEDQKVISIESYSKNNVPDNIKNSVKTKICKPFKI